ncbi:hypothetical protein QBC37DRAFT_460962 [Rhypophila decipiens]|uniref:Uncharacterized protein n=1 Tax=Rhypophila decipiens TaxID=261697 RepID=A0AAN6XSX8_9PEZI|nr:hypothetical protein QBC37DRAFT_460962 [Rhypophila decipiens]
MRDQTDHTKTQKEMVRKRTQSGMSKAKETGVLCNTFIFYIFWNPTYRELQGVAHLPDGMEMPDINSFLQEFFQRGGARTQQNRRRNTRQQGLRESKKVLEEIVVDPSQRDESDASAEDQILQAQAKPANRDICPTQIDPDTTDSLDIGPAGSNPQTLIDIDLRVSEADAAADWDMVDAPTDEINTANDAAFLTQLVTAPEHGLLGAFPSSPRGANKEEINRQARELMQGFVQILGA